jgi:hypothetical protein
MSVCGNNIHVPAYTYYEQEPGRRTAANLLSRDAAPPARADVRVDPKCSAIERAIW